MCLRPRELLTLPHRRVRASGKWASEREIGRKTINHNQWSSTQKSNSSNIWKIINLLNQFQLCVWPIKREILVGCCDPINGSKLEWKSEALPKKKKKKMGKQFEPPAALENYLYWYIFIAHQSVECNITILLMMAFVWRLARIKEANFDANIKNNFQWKEKLKWKKYFFSRIRWRLFKLFMLRKIVL